MSRLQERIAELVEQHGSLRAAARVLEVDPGYLSRLQSGEKDDPGETLLRRMGLRRIVTYTDRAASAGGADQAALSPPAGQEPVAWMWQHEETGLTGFVQHAPEDELRQWERMNRPRKIVAPLFAHPAQQEPVWCGCGDGIMPDTGALCGTCAYVASLPGAQHQQDALDARRYRLLRSCRGQEHDPLLTVQHELDGILWGGDLDAAIDAALPGEGGKEGGK